MIVVFSGYNQRAVMAFLRTLEKNKIDYRIIAAGEDDQILLTAYKDKVVYVRRVEQLDLEDIMEGLEKIRGKDNLIAPSTEALNRFLLVNREYFERLGFVIPLVDEGLYELISDKDKFVRCCRDDDILVPEEHDFIEKFEKPLVAKPREYVGSDGRVYAPIFILNQADKMEFAKQHKVDDFFYQEYLGGGRSVYLLFYFDSKGEYTVLSQENYIQQPGGKSIQCARISDDCKDVAVVEPYARLLKKRNFRGLAMIELRQVGERYYMIEANPRFWGPSQLFCDAGCNLFELFLKDYGVLDEVLVQEPEKVYYFWSNGIMGEEIEKSHVVFHGEGEKIFRDNYKEIEKMEIYRRKDTQKIYDVERMKWLYERTSKHSNYQVLPEALAKFIGGGLTIQSRYEKERLEYIEKYVELKGEKILDIGGNTGFFTIQSVLDGVGQVDYCEGNKAHAEFVKSACEVLDIKQKVKVLAKYYDFENLDDEKYNVVYNLNVLHHMGDDFDSGKGKEIVKKDIINCINGMADIAEVMVLQLGFNWKGNPKECLFEKGTKKEMIDYVENGVRGSWRVKHIGIAVRKSDDGIVYEDVNEKNIERDDSLGEFLNRPIFILESVK